MGIRNSAGVRIGVLFASALATRAISGQGFDGVDPQRQMLFEGQTEIGPGQRYTQAFTTHSNFKNARIAGNVQAHGGIGDDVRVLVTRAQTVIYDSGRRRSVVISVDFSEPGDYALVFDNSFSLFPKVVSGTISLVHWGVDAARNRADQEATRAHYAQATSTLQRLYSALKADEHVLGTTQLSSVPSVQLSNDDSINAWANWSTNSITLNRGLFAFVDRSGDKGKDVLAGTLAHELSHIFYRHPGYGSSTQGAKGLFDELVGVTELDRVQEKEADVLGLRVACQAGFDPEGMLILMRGFAQIDKRASSFMQNHPSGLERLQYLQIEAQRCASLQAQSRIAAPPLMDSRSLRDTAPPTFDVRMRTTKGDATIRITRAWAPNGADRFYNLVRAGFYSDSAFYRVFPNIMIQFGISARPDVSRAWAKSTMPDDRVAVSNLRGRVVFAAGVGPNTRSTQIFINLRDNPTLDRQGFAPIGEIIAGMDVLENVFSGYGAEPNQAAIEAQGKAYLDRDFPNLDRILELSIVIQ